MKFQFCSDGDCPLWALAALHALSSLPAPLFRTLLQRVLDDGYVCTFVRTSRVLETDEHMKRLMTVDEAKEDDGIMEILKDTSLASREECARAAAVIRWVLHQTWRCACPGSQLLRDLLVLGVPRAHAAALAEAADAHREAHVAHAKEKGFMINKVTDVSLTPATEASDALKLTLHTDEVFTGEQKRRELLIERSQAKTLLEELKKAYKKMEELEGQ